MEEIVRKKIEGRDRAEDSDPFAIPRRPALNASILVAFVASLLYFSWWFDEGRLLDGWLLLGFVFAAAYFTLQAYGAWFVYHRMVLPYPSPAPAGLRVDVFVPVFDEPDTVVEEALRSATGIRYPHKTYLLDDSEDGRHRGIAERFGAFYVRRPDRIDAKAGNVNFALRQSSGDFVTIFDVDHLPDPDYLETILGCFDAPRVGFVQSAIGFRNENENWVTRAMAEQSADAYGPASAGMHGCYAAPAWGSHCTFRRKALESIDGHKTGLAEDLHTSLFLHASGWRSAFLPVLVARGLVPRDLVSACKQHFKWARGVFEVLLSVYPRCVSRLSKTQNVAYLLRCSYYLIGPVFLTHGLLTAGALAAGSPSIRGGFSDYLLVALPFAAAIVWVRRLALSYWLGPNERPGTNWRGYLFTMLLWPVYTLALVLTILRVPVSHIPTPKGPAGRSHPFLVVPQILLMLLLLGSVVVRALSGLHPEDVLPVLFALTLATVQAVAVIMTLGAVRRSTAQEQAGRAAPAIGGQE